ncbi:RHS repeat protein [Erwinia pyrifoliae]|nr:RHS repeat protein [Erwinia pyrifoliae]
MCSVLLPDGGQRQSEWDRYGRLLSETDPTGRKTLYQYQRNSDRLVCVTHPTAAARAGHGTARGA